MRSSVRSRLCVVGLAVVVSACGPRTDHYGDIVRSPSGRYGVFATVNRTDSGAKDYADVIVHLVGNGDNEFLSIESRASDAQKWALGWMHDIDVVVLHSSDIGPQAFQLEGVDLVNVDVTDLVRQRACELYKDKYGLLPSSCR